MNRRQLEKIEVSIEMIEATIDEDPDGLTFVRNDLNKLRGSVVSRLRDIVWNEYRKAEA